MSCFQGEYRENLGETENRYRQFQAAVDPRGVWILLGELGVRPCDVVPERITPNFIHAAYNTWLDKEKSLYKEPREGVLACADAAKTLLLSDAYVWRFLPKPPDDLQTASNVEPSYWV